MTTTITPQSTLSNMRSLLAKIKLILKLFIILAILAVKAAEIR